MVRILEEMYPKITCGSINLEKSLYVNLEGSKMVKKFIRGKHWKIELLEKLPRIY